MSWANIKNFFITLILLLPKENLLENQTGRVIVKKASMVQRM